MKVIAATKNKGKIREMQEILAPLDIEIVSNKSLELMLMWKKRVTRL